MQTSDSRKRAAEGGPMTEPSDKAVKAAAEATCAGWHNSDPLDRYPCAHCLTDATAALQAAYPIIEAEIRAKIAAEIEAFFPDPHDEDEKCDDCHLISLLAAGVRGEASA